MPAAIPTSPRSAASPVAASSQTRPLLRGRVLVGAGILLLAFNLRTAVTALPPVFDRVQTDLAMSVTVAGLVGTAPTAAFAVFAAAAPAVVRRLGLERTAWLAMAVAAAGHLLRAAAPGTATFLLATVVALAAMGVGNVVAPPLVKRYFGDRVGTVTGLYVLFISLGTALPAQLAVPLEAAGSWRLAVGAWAVLAVTAAVPWVVVWRREARRAALERATSPAVAERVTWTRLAGSPVAWGLAVMMGTTSLGTYALLTWLPTIVVEAGVERATAGTMLAVFAGLGMPLSLAVPPLAARMRNPAPLVLLAVAAMLAGCAGMASAPLSWTWVWVVLLGLGGAPFPLALALINLRSSTQAGATGLSGFAQGVGYTIACAGPVVAGLLREVTGSWTATLGFLAVVLVITAVGGVVACRPVTVEQSLARR